MPELSSTFTNTTAITCAFQPSVSSTVNTCARPTVKVRLRVGVLASITITTRDEQQRAFKEGGKRHLSCEGTGYLPGFAMGRSKMYRNSKVR